MLLYWSCCTGKSLEDARNGGCSGMRQKREHSELKATGSQDILTCQGFELTINNGYDNFVSSAVGLQTGMRQIMKMLKDLMNHSGFS